jgi:ectoine hydroxylase-related dioxygenase (phytanoyl-CoA dioxygenase family)
MEPLSEDQVSSYLTNGFFVLRGLFDAAELSSLRPAVPAPSSPQDDDATFNKCVVFGCARTGEDPSKINKLEGLGRLHETARNSQLLALFRRVSLDPRIVAIAHQLLGAGAELMKDKYIYKGKGGGDGFPPHQDMNFIYSRVATEAVNFGVAFDAADETNGALEVCIEPGSYAKLAGRLARTPLEVASTYESTDHLRFAHVRTEPGDVIVFSGWLLHRSTKNGDFARDRNVYYVTCKSHLVQIRAGSSMAAVRRASCLCPSAADGTPGYRTGVLGATGNLYRDYYELHEAWVAAGFPFGDEVTTLLGADKPRPSMVPDHRIGVGWPPSAAGGAAGPIDAD